MNEEVHLGVKDRYDEIADTNMSIKGLQIFKRWYGQANATCPNSNVWRYDLGKLVVPTFFKDVDLLLELVARYDQITHEIRDIKENVLLRIYVDSIK